MISDVTTERIRRLVSEIHGRGQVIPVYGLVQKIANSNGTIYNMRELANLIAEESIRQKATVRWDQADAQPDHHAQP